MPTNVDTDLLRAFVAVAETGSFTRAAERLNCTQSAVSMRVQRLERVTRGELLIRSNKGLSLTPAGERLIDYACKIVNLNDQLLETVLDRRTGGVVRIGLMEDYASTVLPPLVKQFLRLHPNVCIEVYTGLTPLMRSQLGKSFDLVVAMQMQNAGSGEFLRKERPVWARAKTMSTEHDCIPIALYPRDCVFRDIMLDSLKAAGRKWRAAYHSHSITAVQSAIKEGIALGVLKKSTLPQQLRLVSDECGFAEMPRVDIVLHRAAGIKRSSPANLFGDFLLSTMGSEPMEALPPLSALTKPRPIGHVSQTV